MSKTVLFSFLNVANGIGKMLEQKSTLTEGLTELNTLQCKIIYDLDKNGLHKIKGIKNTLIKRSIRLFCNIPIPNHKHLLKLSHII